MPVSERHSKLVYDALIAVGVEVVSALPETWLVHLIRLAEDDPGTVQLQVARASTLAEASLSPVALLLTRDLMWEALA